MKTQEIRDLFSDISKKAKAEGASVELEASNSESFGATFTKDELSKFSSDQSQGIGIRVLRGQSAGYATTENFSREEIMNCYQEALQSAKDLNEGVDPNKMAQTLWKGTGVQPLKGLFQKDSFNRPVEEKLNDARSLEKSALAYHQDIASVPYSGYSENQRRKILLNSEGLDVESEAGGVSGYSYALAKKGDDSKMNGFGGFYRDVKQFSAEQIAKEAAERSLSMLGATQPKTGKYTVVLSHEVASQMIGYLFDHVSAKAVDQGTSLFKDKLGEVLISQAFTIEDDPFLVQSSGARAFDSEGTPSQKTQIFEKGVLKSYLTNSYLAKKMNLPHTAHASRSGGEMGISTSNIVVSKGQKSFEELLKSEKNLIYITTVDALHSGFQSTSLNFSLPGHGFFYENGERKNAIHQFVVSGNLLQWLKSVADLSSRVSNHGDSVLCPDLLVPEVSIAGA